MKVIKLVMVGFGAIGRAVARTLVEKSGSFKREHGVELKVVAICEAEGSVINEEGIELEKILNEDLKKDKHWCQKKSIEVLKSVNADIMLEFTPGSIKTGEPGLKHIEVALERGMNVVTSNKAPLALKFHELMELAKKNNAQLRYEATVGGAIPLINLVEKTLQANKIEAVEGILNGTCNFILSKMAEEGIELQVALKEAQELKIAEPDPSYDLKGIDTAAKVAILANSMLGKKVTFSDISIEGIEKITVEAIELAKKHGRVIKLIGDVSKLRVSPRLIDIDDPLNVSGTLNAIRIKSDVAKDIILIGHGAGPRETSSSVISDVLTTAKDMV